MADPVGACLVAIAIVVGLVAAFCLWATWPRIELNEDVEGVGEVRPMRQEARRGE